MRVRTDADEPCYPFHFHVGDQEIVSYGLNKREHFAALMMSGFLASGRNADPYGAIEGDAALAVACADALIEALNEPPDDPGDCDK